MNRGNVPSGKPAKLYIAAIVLTGVFLLVSVIVYGYNRLQFAAAFEQRDGETVLVYQGDVYVPCAIGEDDSYAVGDMLGTVRPAGASWFTALTSNLPLCAVRYDPDGAFLVAGMDGALRLYCREDWRERVEAPRSTVTAISVSWLGNDHLTDPAAVAAIRGFADAEGETVTFPAEGCAAFSYYLGSHYDGLPLYRYYGLLAVVEGRYVFTRAAEGAETLTGVVIPDDVAEGITAEGRSVFNKTLIKKK